MAVGPDFLLRVLSATPQSYLTGGTTYVIVRRPYAYLAEELRLALQGREDVKVLVDRRQGERRARNRRFAVDRRRSDRRGTKEELLEVVVVPSSPTETRPGVAPAPGGPR